MFICCLFPKVRVGTCYLSQYIFTLDHSRWPVWSFDQMTPPSRHSMSYEVTFVFASNFLQNRHKVLGMVPICFSWTDASTDMQCDLLVPTRDLTWPWPEVKFGYRPFKVNVYLFRWVSTSRTRCCPNSLTSFLISKVICEKRHFRKKKLFNISWPL